MPTQTRVVLKLDSLNKLTDEPGMVNLLRRKADAVHATARARAPRRTGLYADSFTITWARWARRNRRIIRVYNHAPYAIDLEYGGSRSAKYRVLGTAIDAANGG